MWLVALGKILSLDKLRRQHIMMMDKCCICKMNEESVDPLFLYCDVASAIWSAFFSRFGLSWVLPRHVVNMFKGKIYFSPPNYHPFSF